MLNACLADLKSSCFSVCLRSFLIETKKQKKTKTKKKTLHLRKGQQKSSIVTIVDKIILPIAHQLTEVISQRYNRLHQLHRKNKASKISDTRLNGRYELIQKYTLFEGHQRALLQQGKIKKNRIFPFVRTQYYPTVLNPKEIPMGEWHRAQQQPLFREIFKEPPLISYRKGRLLRHTCESKIIMKARKPDRLWVV